jgi:hypothetical protein
MQLLANSPPGPSAKIFDNKNDIKANSYCFRTHRHRCGRRQWSGGLSTVVPPGPISNPEVKRCSADGSAAKGCARVGRRQFFPIPLGGWVFLCSFHKKRLNQKRRSGDGPWYKAYWDSTKNSNHRPQTTASENSQIFRSCKNTFHS